jgi:cyclopropane fatty-acyl-phospholipid synthase-like methyltransferase
MRRQAIPIYLLDAIKSVIQPGESILDIGSSVGWLVYLLRREGFKIDGVDGSENVEQVSSGLVQQLDLVSGDCSPWIDRYDWGLFYEVGEHVPAQYEDVLVRNVASIPKKGLIVSWNAYNTKREDHVNLRPEKYVVSLFSKYGMVRDDTATDRYRQLFGEKKSRKYNPFVLIRSS